MTYTKSNIWPLLICIVLLIVSLIAFLDGCDTSLPGSCIYYRPFQGKIVEFYSKPIECESCDKTTKKCEKYACYDWFVQISQENPENIECHSLIKSKLSYPVQNTTTEYHIYKLNHMYEVFQMTKHPETCIIDSIGTYESNTITGIVLFLLFGIAFAYLILSFCANHRSSPKIVFQPVSNQV